MGKKGLFAAVVTLLFFVSPLSVLGETNASALSQDNRSVSQGGASMQVFIHPETGERLTRAEYQAYQEKQGIVPVAPSSQTERPAQAHQVIHHADGSVQVFFPNGFLIEEKIEVTPEGQVKPVLD